MRNRKKSDRPLARHRTWAEYRQASNEAGGYTVSHFAEGDAGRFPVEPPEHPAKPHARWALDLYRECQRDAEGDPWYEPGGAERRLIAKLREYAGAE